MSSEAEAVSVEILDKEYMVACPPEERDALMESAKLTAMIFAPASWKR